MQVCNPTSLCSVWVIALLFAHRWHWCYTPEKAPSLRIETMVAMRRKKNPVFFTMTVVLGTALLAGMELGAHRVGRDPEAIRQRISILDVRICSVKPTLMIP